MARCSFCPWISLSTICFATDSAYGATDSAKSSFISRRSGASRPTVCTGTLSPARRVPDHTILSWMPCMSLKTAGRGKRFSKTMGGCTMRRYSMGSWRAVGASRAPLPARLLALASSLSSESSGPSDALVDSPSARGGTGDLPALRLPRQFCTLVRLLSRRVHVIERQGGLQHHGSQLQGRLAEVRPHVEVAEGRAVHRDRPGRIASVCQCGELVVRIRADPDAAEGWSPSAIQSVEPSEIVLRRAVHEHQRNVVRLARSQGRLVSTLARDISRVVRRGRVRRQDDRVVATVDHGEDTPQSQLPPSRPWLHLGDELKRLAAAEPQRVKPCSEVVGRHAFHPFEAHELQRDPVIDVSRAVVGAHLAPSKLVLHHVAIANRGLHGAEVEKPDLVVPHILDPKLLVRLGALQLKKAHPLATEVLHPESHPIALAQGIEKPVCDQSPRDVALAIGAEEARRVRTASSRLVEHLRRHQARRRRARMRPLRASVRQSRVGNLLRRLDVHAVDLLALVGGGILGHDLGLEHLQFGQILLQIHRRSYSNRVVERVKQCRGRVDVNRPWHIEHHAEAAAGAPLDEDFECEGLDKLLPAAQPVVEVLRSGNDLDNDVLRVAAMAGEGPLPSQGARGIGRLVLHLPALQAPCGVEVLVENRVDNDGSLEDVDSCNRQVQSKDWIDHRDREVAGVDQDAARWLVHLIVQIDGTVTRERILATLGALRAISFEA
eukprot:scaffold757_cov246-Pinguiococcus_pyrenoidosus.AAC.10